MYEIVTLWRVQPKMFCKSITGVLSLVWVSLRPGELCPFSAVVNSLGSIARIYAHFIPDLWKVASHELKGIKTTLLLTV